MTEVNRAWILVQRPVGEDYEAALAWREMPVPEPGPGEVLIRTIYLSLDPANRGWMAGPSYMPAVPLDSPMWGGVIGRVVKSNAPGFTKGELVMTLGWWADYCVMPAERVNKLPNIPGVPLVAFQGVLGGGGLTAYFGLLDVGKVKAGETLVVSGAAGSVGCVAGQIGKILGCRVIGIAGSGQKCEWLTSELGFDHAIDYRIENVGERIAALCPDGVDAYFENVGGAIGNAVIANLAQGGRVILCGLISQYNAVGKPEGVDISPILTKSASIHGFIVINFMHRAAEASAALAGWLLEGKLKAETDIVEGLEHTLTAFRRLFDSGGPHRGKLVVRVSSESA